MDGERRRRKILAGPFGCLMMVALAAAESRAQHAKPDDVRPDAVIVRSVILSGNCRKMESLSPEEVIDLLDEQRKLKGALSKFFKEHPGEVGLIKARVHDRIDPPRIFPLVGPAELHHARFACTVIVPKSANLILDGGAGGNAATIEIQVRHRHLVSGERAEGVRYRPRNEWHAGQECWDPMLPPGRYIKSKGEYLRLDSGSQDDETPTRIGFLE